MKSERMTQLEKFNVKHFKDKLDIESLLQAELDRKQKLLECKKKASRSCISWIWYVRL